ncbi:CMRF35-like molecule 5 [Podarcis muralis]
MWEGSSCLDQTMQPLSLFGLIFLLPGCFSDLTVLKMHAILGGLASVECRYDERYKGNPKYWCKEMSKTSCDKIVETSGSEEPVRKGRVSIRDNHSLNQFTVTIDELTNSDSGMYKCGMIVQGGSDLMVPVNVTEITRGPEDAFHKDISSIRYLVYMSFLVSVALKAPIFLGMILAIIWMRSKKT